MNIITCTMCGIERKNEEWKNGWKNDGQNWKLCFTDNKDIDSFCSNQGPYNGEGSF